MATLKRQYENCKVTVNANGLGRIVIDTSTADLSKWATIPEFAFMFEETAKVEPKKEQTKAPEKETDKTDYSNYTLKELREKFPDIKATSVKAFIEKLT